ncbi:hypothetical protein CPAR01_07811 [Colletotrichum paranaense]|uniref:Nucleoside phosphorylase domain-containing protein n=1 Tax=Colletotrichum paranaense TaxID=1914294 RepID=A0ABQ9SIG9_9PEZI|nr:uncharacterized protein CPAR01_07811 [Colletotrichum paranaense]KAK1537698.1 hypothetical protein CPAR01_07811 [Colletotrichum paranaense]
MNGKRPAPDDAQYGSSGALKWQRTLLDNWDGERRRPTDGIPQEYHRYAIAWICALPIELVAAEAMLDEKHDVLPSYAPCGNAYTVDTNIYTLGSIWGHNVVIACLPAYQYGTNNAANVTTHLVRTFPSIQLALMVGIGGGVPSSARDIRLGDVVVGVRTMQYDLGKIVAAAEIQRTAIARTLHQSFGKAITVLRARHEREPSQVYSILTEKFANLPHYGRPTVPDHLFLSTYDHPESTTTCDDCDPTKRMPRRARLKDNPVIHYGAIASGNQVMKNAVERDLAARTLDIICFEMEAAGIIDIVPCLPIRGICDYADSHKNKAWQRHAAAIAAAYARELLSVLPSAESGTQSISCLGPSQIQLNLYQRQDQLVEALKFDQMDSRQSTVKKAHIKTCTWLIRHLDYQRWLKREEFGQHHGLLWIRGKPGAGKSTIMKFALSEMQKDPDWSPLAVSFFFNARGEYLERSNEGMYRSLLFQLFQGYPQLRRVLGDLRSTQQKDERCPSLDTLKDLFSRAVLALGQRRLTCFVDALDECDEQQMMDMVRDFEDLAEEASTKGIAFRICLSSRHYPYIVIKKGLALILENQSGHTQDMKRYIQSRLRFDDPTLAEDLQAELLEKAAGVFLWLVLVVDILNTEYSQGGLALKKRLIEIPNDLGTLFRDILTRDRKNMEHLCLCIIWILCAKRPLRPSEFCHALWSGLSQNGLVDPNLPVVTEHSARRCVIGFSKGLADVTESMQPTVQFIHESVRDYLLKGGVLPELWPDLGFDWELLSHEKLKLCCSAYINHYLASGHVFKKCDTTQFPFMEYASQQVLLHADAAAAGISQHQFLSKFPLKEWISIFNCYEKVEIRHYTYQASLYYICSVMDCSTLIPMIQGGGWQCRSADRYNYPLFAALAHGNSKSVAALFGMTSIIYEGMDIMEGLPPRGDFFGFELRTPLSWAAQGGRLGMVTLLLRAKNHVNEPDQEGFTPLHRAAGHGHKPVAKLLVDNGADVDAVDKYMRTPLFLAVMQGREATVKTLIEHTADTNARSDKHFSTPLYEASRAGYKIDPPEAIVKVIIENGAEVNSKHGNCDTALHVASSVGDKRITKSLVENVADVNAINEVKRTALHCVCNGNATEGDLHEDKASRALPIFDAHGGHHTALPKVDQVITNVLIDDGPDVNHSIHRDNAALKLSSSFTHEKIVRLLMENGAFGQAIDNRQTMRMHPKLIRPHCATAQFLLDNQAALNVFDINGNTPLTFAVYGRDRELLQLLLEHGAEVDLTGGSHTPLLIAIRIRQEDMVVDLIKHGANVTFSDYTGMTPLSAAREVGCSAWLIRLLERLSDI